MKITQLYQYQIVIVTSDGHEIHFINARDIQHALIQVRSLIMGRVDVVKVMVCQ